MKYNCTEKISTITTIPETALKELWKKQTWCISDAILNAKLENSNETKVDIGIGELTIWFKDDLVKYRFTPSAKLSKAVKSTICSNKSLMVENIDNGLVNKFIDTYKKFL